MRRCLRWKFPFVAYGVDNYILGFAVVRAFALRADDAGNLHYSRTHGLRYYLVQNIIRIYGTAIFHYSNAFFTLVTKSANSLAMSFSACFSADVSTSRPLLST